MAFDEDDERSWVVGNASRMLQIAYDLAGHLETLSGDRDAVFTVRALASASFGVCQAVVTVGEQLDPETEHAVVFDLACRLVSACHALGRQRSASANLACRDLERAVNMLGKMTEITWPTIEQEEAYGV
jgi:hypothetical protein